MAEKTQRKVTQVMAKKKCTCPDHFPEPPRKPKSVGVKAYGLRHDNGEIEAWVGRSKLEAESKATWMDCQAMVAIKPKAIPVMIVPCREGKRG